MARFNLVEEQIVGQHYAVEAETLLEALYKLSNYTEYEQDITIGNEELRDSNGIDGAYNANWMPVAEKCDACGVIIVEDVCRCGNVNNQLW